MSGARLLCFLWLSLLLAGCSLAGGYIGSRKDAETVGTRQIPVSQAGKLSAGTVVYATCKGGEPIKGRFRGTGDSAGIRLFRMDTGDGKVSLPLDSLTDLVAEVRRKGNTQKGLMIGAAIDAVVLVGMITFAFIMVQYTIKHILQ